MSEWQPIETAPQRTEVLVHVVTKNMKISFRQVGRLVGSEWFTDDGILCDADEAKHWMSLPEPPK